VITFKCQADLGQLPQDHSAYPVIKELIELLIDGFPIQPYSADDHGYLVLVEPGDTDRELLELDMPWRLAEIPWEGAPTTTAWGSSSRMRRGSTASSDKSSKKSSIRRTHHGQSQRSP
jgi:hypothetical protein